MGRNVAWGEMSQGETSWGEMSRGETSFGEKRRIALVYYTFEFGNESMLLNFEYSSPHSLASPS